MWYWPQLYAMVQLSLYVYILRYPFGYTYVATVAAVALMAYMFVAFIHRHVTFASFTSPAACQACRLKLPLWRQCS
jgi:hypothetical protein